MNEVKFEIPDKRWFGRRKMIQKVVSFPSKLDDLTPEQFQYFFKLTELDIEEIQRRILFLHHISSLPKKHFLRLREGDIYTLTELLDFINLGEISKAPVFNKSLFPGIKVKGKYYTGPSDELMNMVYLQFSSADYFAFMFSKTSEVKYLDDLFSVLYCDGAFDEHQDEPMLIVAKQVPAYLKMAAMFNFVCLKAHLPIKYKHAFGEKENKDALKKAPEFPDYHSMNIALAGQKFGTIKEVKYANIHDVFKFIDDNEKQAKEE